MENFKNVIVTDELTVKQVSSFSASLNFSESVQTIFEGNLIVVAI